MTIEVVWISILVAACSAAAGWAGYLLNRRKAHDDSMAASAGGRITAQTAHDLAIRVGNDLVDHLRDFTDHRVRIAAELAELRTSSAATSRAFEATEARIERSIAAVHTDMREGFAAVGDRLDRVAGRIDAIQQSEISRHAGLARGDGA
ncbi:hypothetical protein [Rhodoplanes sp. SY1]|uniref:hypothetical protein n=1 Tax=Rhodoplanes sp. SY1 TaxID=3166646 RepID=UPI0038B42455